MNKTFLQRWKENTWFFGILTAIIFGLLLVEERKPWYALTVAISTFGILQFVYLTWTLIFVGFKNGGSSNNAGQ